MANPVSVTRHDDIAVVVLDNPPVNALSHAVRIALVEALKELFSAPGVAAIVIACAGRTFIAGADIREFGKAPLLPDLPDVVEFLDGAPCLTVAAIHGTALGGGLELALACHFRLATASAKLGLPEVTLGILPGAGGTQRLPRLIGVRPALDMIVSGTPISAAEAQRLGLVDEIIADDVLESALAFARRAIAERRGPRRVSSANATLDDPNLFPAYEQRIAARWRGFLAPFRCIEAVRAATELPFDAGLERERALFRELMASSESKAQRHLFFGEREVAKVPGLPDDTSVRAVKSVAVAGAGPAASELVRSFADARVPVTLIAETRDDIERVRASVRDGYASDVVRGSTSEAECAARLERIHSSLSYEEGRNVDLWIEAAAEGLEAKREALARMDRVAKPGAILASTTSSVELDLVASATGRPADVVGIHLVGLLDRPKLLEAVRGPRSAADAYATLVKLARSVGKVAVPVRDHVASRLLAQRTREALFLLEEGALPEEIDRALTDFGFAIGPFAALDAAGLDAALAERRTKLPKLTARERGGTILEELVALGRSGRRAGAGFYRYDGAQATPDERVAALLVKHSKQREIARRAIPVEEIRERCLYSIVNEAARVLEEGAAARPLDIDMICVHGFHFPVYRGGPLFFADHVGLRQVYERILSYREQVGEEYWSPAPRLERFAASGSRFYDQP